MPAAALRRRSPSFAVSGGELGRPAVHDVSLRELRKYVFDCFLDTARAPLLEEIMRRFHLGREDASQRLHELEAAHHLVLVPGTDRILTADPFSNLPTPFRVSTGPMQYYANGAWDAIAMHVMLDWDVHIASFCHHCGVPIELGLSQGRLTTDRAKDVLVFLGTPVARWYDNPVESGANSVVFFASRDHLNSWQKIHPRSVGPALSVDKMVSVVTPMSRGRAALEYEMPSTDQLMAHWSALGLAGPFWTF